jgi:hypothetical protein
VLNEVQRALELAQTGAMYGGSTIALGMLVIYCTLGRGLRPIAAGRKQRQVYAEFERKKGEMAKAD